MDEVIGHRILVATDGSVTAGEAVRWAATQAKLNDADLVVVRVVPPAQVADDPGIIDALTVELNSVAAQCAGPKGTARLLIDDDPALCLVRAAAEENADLIVIGSLGMAGRKEFLRGNVPNRVTHLSACTVVVVKTGPDNAMTTQDRSRRSSQPPVDKPYLLARAAHIARVIGRHHLAKALRHPPTTAAARSDFGRQLRLALDELGPTFAKMGQMLSTRPDLVAPEVLVELAALQEHVSPLTQEQVVDMVEAEWGIPWEDVLGSIEAHPLAAGTIAQVHRATLLDGTPVVLKIQRPQARADIEQDLQILHTFADRAAQRATISHVLDAAGIFKLLTDSLTRELDFSQEARSIERMRDVLKSYPRLGVPEVYDELSTSRLLVIEEIVGLPLREVPAGTARKEAALQLAESYYHQIISVGFFHADPHPGNFIWREDRLYFLDFGMVGEIDDPTRELLMLLLVALWRNDPALLAEVAVLLGGRQTQVGPGFETELGELLTRYHNTRLSDIELGVLLQQMTQIALAHEVQLPSALVLATKALAQMQLAVAGLDPTLDPIAAAGSFMTGMLLKRMQEELDPKKLLSDLMRLRARGGRLVEALERATGARPGPGPEVRVQGSEKLEKSVRQAGRRVAVSVGVAGAMVAAAIGWSPRHRIRK